MNNCVGRECGCASQTSGDRWHRRQFLAALSLGAAGLAAQPWRAMAGPFTHRDFEKLVPADKKLHPDWVRSLTERGQRAVYRGADLEKIGMPVGGLCAGQVYLGGDGKLWHWDIFNRHTGTGSEHYAKPVAPNSPLDQGFALQVRVNDQVFVRSLDRSGWPDISFAGEYPIGRVEYRSPDFPVRVELEAFSPFVPLNVDDSSLPATVMEFTVRNEGQNSAQVELTGWLENAVCLHSSEAQSGIRRNRLVRNSKLLFLECSAKAPPARPPTNRPDIPFEDFEHETYGDWIVTGTAFGSGPVDLSKVPDYQGDLAGHGKRVVNSHASAPGTTVEARDGATGTVSSPPFPINRDYIKFLIGGGSHRGKTCVNLLVEGKIVRSATGSNNNRMQPTAWNVQPWAGKVGQIQIVDQESGPWGNIGVDDIVLTDHPREASTPLAAEPDFGTLGLALLGTTPHDWGSTVLPDSSLEAICSKEKISRRPVERPFPEKLVGAVGRKLTLKPGASAKATFVLTWHMPNLKINRLPSGRYYAKRFDSALSVAGYIASHFNRLSAQTRLWHKTWYDSTLPYWFLDRTFLNTSILATSTCYRLGNGRFYAWEGVGCCEGTCGHVWQYAHATARLFPELERLTREQVDFGLALQPDGAIHFRGEFNDFPAIDAQAGTILRALREHQTSADDAFLRRIWPRVKRATEWLIAKDGDADGLIESNQHNTLDTDWFGPVAWLSGLYLAALEAAKTMATEMGEMAFAERCHSILAVGQKRLVAELFDGEYFVNKPDPQHLDAINSGSGCEIDQVFGQSWAFQVGLPRILPQRETVSALKSLWRYNFTPDVGPYRAEYKAGRWYAMPGEAGLLMCAFPREDWDYAQAKGKGPDWAAGYFNECMNGFEYQVAGHMIWEGLLTEGLAVTRAVHDRYHPSRRNPWNEIECGDHYARSMASYGVFLAACGFEYHGPAAYLGFSPPLTSQTLTSGASLFRCPFTAAEGWGTFEQRRQAETQIAEVLVRWGTVRLRTLALTLADGFQAKSVEVRLDNNLVASDYIQTGDRMQLALKPEAEIGAGRRLEVRIS